MKTDPYLVFCTGMVYEYMIFGVTLVMCNHVCTLLIQAIGCFLSDDSVRNHPNYLD
jgi:hypothetical protein